MFNIGIEKETTLPPLDSEVFPLSPLGHIMPRKHTFRLFYFPTSNAKDPEAIAKTLRQGLQSLISTLSLLAGTVTHLPSTEQRGRLAITAPFHKVDDLLRVRDLSSSSLSYDDLRQRGFPINAFTFQEVLTISTNYGEMYGLEKPVLLAQLNFMNGGFVLGVCLHHSILDGTACVEVMRAWATFCGGRNEELRLSPTLMDRGRLLQEPERQTALDGFPEFLDKSKNMKSEEEDAHPTASVIPAVYCYCPLWQRLRTFIAQIFVPRPPVPKLFLRLFNNTSHLRSVKQAIYFFPNSTLSTLKTNLWPAPPYWISTNDALSALLFCCIISARNPPPTNTSTTVPLAINLNGRNQFTRLLPPDYLGNAVLHAQISASYAELQPTLPNISKVALRVRQRVQEVTTTEYAERFLAALHDVEDISAVTAGYAPKGMIVAPWQGQGYHGIDWGDLGGVGLGKIERMRAANEVRIREGICQIFPRWEGSGEREEGRLEVMVGLGPETTDKVRGMQIWREWARWRCD